MLSAGARRQRVAQGPRAACDTRQTVLAKPDDPSPSRRRGGRRRRIAAARLRPSRGGARAPSSTETASVSSAIRSANGEQLLVRDPEADPVDDLEAGLLAQHLDVADQVVEARLEPQLVVERRVERDGHPVLGGDRPAFEADTLDEHLVRLEHVAVDPEAAAVELLEAALGERGAHLARAPRRASARARGRFGFTRSSDAGDVAELDRLDAQLLGDLVARARCAPSAPATTSRAAAGGASAPTPSAPAGRARRPGARPRSPSSSAASGSADLGPAGEEHRRRPALHEVPPEVVGEERHHRRDHAQRLHERVPERPERRRRPPARSAGASGGCTSSRGRPRTPRTP